MVKSTVVGITPGTHGDSHRTGGTDPLTGAVGIDNLDYIRKAITLSDTVIYEDLASEGTVGNVYTVAKDAIINVAGSLRITYTMDADGTGYFYYAKLFRNGVLLTGTEQVKDGTTLQTWNISEDIHEWSPGDLFEVWAKSNNVSRTCSIKDLRCRGTLRTISDLVD